ncbi:EutN/CcmL family microcompartment protein [Fusibacter sp. JL298sf-3]
MKFGRVKGTVVATTKNAHLVGTKLLIVQPTDENFNAVGHAVVAVDSVGAGNGDRVLYVTGSVSKTVLSGPVDATIVAIIDTVEVQ